MLRLSFLEALDRCLDQIGVKTQGIVMVVRPQTFFKITLGINK